MDPRQPHRASRGLRLQRRSRPSTLTAGLGVVRFDPFNPRRPGNDLLAFGQNTLALGARLGAHLGGGLLVITAGEASHLGEALHLGDALHREEAFSKRSVTETLVASIPLRACDPTGMPGGKDWNIQGFPRSTYRPQSNLPSSESRLALPFSALPDAGYCGSVRPAAHLTMTHQTAER